MTSIRNHAGREQYVSTLSIRIQPPTLMGIMSTGARCLVKLDSVLETSVTTE